MKLVPNKLSSTFSLDVTSAAKYTALNQSVFTYVCVTGLEATR